MEIEMKNSGNRMKKQKKNDGKQKMILSIFNQ